jgi:hypothetical protein
METLKRESAPFIQTYADYFRLLKKPSDMKASHSLYSRPYELIKRWIYGKSMSYTLISLMRDYGVSEENWSAVSIKNSRVHNGQALSISGDVVYSPSRMRRSSIVVYLMVDVQTLNSDLVKNGLGPVSVPGTGHPSRELCTDYVIVRARAPYEFSVFTQLHSIRDCIIIDVDVDLVVTNQARPLETLTVALAECVVIANDV